jgi:hypothetical protein
MFKAMFPDEEEEVTSSVKRSNSLIARSLIGKRAIGFCPVSLDAKMGVATKFEMLPCGDPLFCFVCDDREEMWIHEIEVQ